MIYSAKNESRTCLLSKHYYFLSPKKTPFYSLSHIAIFLAFVFDKKEFAANITLAKKYKKEPECC